MEFFEERDFTKSDRIKEITESYFNEFDRDISNEKFHSQEWISWSMSFKPDVYDMKFYNNLIRKNIEEQKTLYLCELTNINVGFESGHGECRNHKIFMILYNLIVKHNLQKFTKQFLLKYGVDKDIVDTLKLNKEIERTFKSRIDYMTFFLSMEAIFITQFYKFIDLSEFDKNIPKLEFFKACFSRMVIKIDGDKFYFENSDYIRGITPNIIIENSKQLDEVKKLLRSLNKDVAIGLGQISERETLTTKKENLTAISTLKFLWQKFNDYDSIKHAVIYSHSMDEIIDSNDFFELYNGKFTFPFCMFIEDITSDKVTSYIPETLNSKKLKFKKYNQNFPHGIGILLDGTSQEDYKTYLKYVNDFTDNLRRKMNGENAIELKFNSKISKTYKHFINDIIKFNNTLDENYTKNNLWYSVELYNVYGNFLINLNQVE